MVNYSGPREAIYTPIPHEGKNHGVTWREISWFPFIMIASLTDSLQALGIYRDVGPAWEVLVLEEGS
jgi:hypothetical protein